MGFHKYVLADSETASRMVMVQRRANVFCPLWIAHFIKSLCWSIFVEFTEVGVEEAAQNQWFCDHDLAVAV